MLGELKRYIRSNSLKLSFLKIRTQFFSRLRNRGFKKVWLRKQLATLKYEDREKLMTEKRDRERGGKPQGDAQSVGRRVSFPNRQGHQKKQSSFGTSPDTKR